MSDLPMCQPEEEGDGAERLARFDAAVALYMAAMRDYRDARLTVHARAVSVQHDPAPLADDWFRASGELHCDRCQMPYLNHPEDPRHRWLRVLCDGRRIKP